MADYTNRPIPDPETRHRSTTGSSRFGPKSKLPFKFKEFN